MDKIKYITEATNFNTLLNMVVISRNHKDLDHVESIINKAKDKGIINDKEYSKLTKEIKSLRKNI